MATNLPNDKKPDIVFINTPVHDYSNYPRFQSSYSAPLGLLYLATAVEDAGFSPYLIDAEAKQLSPRQISAMLNRLRPRFVAMNSFSVNFRFIRPIVEGIKNRTKIIIGGPHTSLSSYSHLNTYFRFADFIVQQEGEHKLTSILTESDPNQISDILFRDSSGILKRTKAPSKPFNLDSVKFPRRNLNPFEPYYKDGRRWMDISISRGCIFECVFCAGSCSTNGSTYHRRNNQSILDEIRFLTESYQPTGFEIVDDLPFRSKDELLSFFRLLDTQNFSGLAWDINLPLAILKKLSEKDLFYLKKFGLFKLAFGIESGAKETRKLMGKTASNDEIFNLSKILSDLHIRHKTYFILGFPGEKKQDTLRTVYFAKRLFHNGIRGGRPECLPRIFAFKPFPGSALWRSLILKGYSEDNLLNYLDYSVDNEYFMKHAWKSKIHFAEVDHKEISDIINEFYNSVGKNAF